MEDILETAWIQEEIAIDRFDHPPQTETDRDVIACHSRLIADHPIFDSIAFAMGLDMACRSIFGMSRREFLGEPQDWKPL